MKVSSSYFWVSQIFPRVR